LIVDDGSTDETSKVAFNFVKQHKIDNVRVLLLGRNHGKGEAVRKVSVELPAYTASFK
jgi:dolichyl-phosphate beta-glucosyltransferase